MKYIILTIGILITTNLQAQYFNTNLGRLDPYSEFSGSKALPYQDSLWLINMFITRFENNNYGFFNSIIVINDKGVYKKEIFYKDTLFNFRSSDWLIINNEINIIGTEYDANNNSNFFLLKLDNDLNFLSKEIIQIPREIGNIKKMQLLPNGNLAFCGFIQNYDEVNSEYEEQQAIFFVLNNDGKEVWHYEYGDSINDEKFHDFTWDQDTNFYLTGQWIEPYFDGDFQNVLVKLNSKGDLIWDYKYGKKEDLNGWPVIKYTQNNDLILFGVYNAADWMLSYGGLEIAILDTTGIVKDVKRYFSFNVEPYDCVQDNNNNNNYVCVGQTPEPDGKNISGFIVKINLNGDTVWTRNYPLYIENKKYSHRFYRINNFNDGFILTGSTLTKSNPGFGHSQQAWVMTIDSLGYDHITQFPTSTFEPEIKLENNIITFYPNPTSGELFIRWKELIPLVKDRWVVSFYDLQGRLVYTHPMSLNENSLMLESLSPGVYPYVIRDSKNAYITKGKVVVQSKH